MTRLLFILGFSLFNLSAHPREAAESRPAPDQRDAFFPNPGISVVQASPECPGPSCLVGPVSLTRDPNAPAKQVSEFLGTEGQEAELVVVSSDRKRTTVQAWLNGERVLLPSTMPRSGTDEVRVPVTLKGQNVLEVRLTAKPGTEVVFWVEGETATPSLPPDLEPTFEFRASDARVGPTVVMNAVCSTEFGADFEIADWADILAGIDPTPIQQAGTAWIQRDGIGSFSASFFGPIYHYLVSAVGNLYPNFHYGTIEPDLFWLNAAGGDRQVLCKGPPGS